MTSWLSWPSLEHSHRPLTTLYAPSQSWTSLTSSQSSNRSVTWTTRARTCLLPPPPSLRLQLLPGALKTRPHCHHHLPPLLLPRTHKIGLLIAPNATSAHVSAILRPSASSRRS